MTKNDAGCLDNESVCKKKNCRQCMNECSLPFNIMLEDR